MNTATRALDKPRRLHAARRAAGWLIEVGGLAILATQAWRIA